MNSRKSVEAMSREELEELIKATQERAIQVLAETWNCALSPLKALYEALGLTMSPEDEAGAIAFAGGISGKRSLCGALWAAVKAASAYIGLRRGVCRDCRGAEFIRASQPIHAVASRVYDEFHRAHGSVLCRDLNPDFDYTSRRGQARCTSIVASAVRIAIEAVWEEMRGKQGRLTASRGSAG